MVPTGDALMAAPQQSLSAKWFVETVTVSMVSAATVHGVGGSQCYVGGASCESVLLVFLR